jgi:hypothetical protein
VINRIEILSSGSRDQRAPVGRDSARRTFAPVSLRRVTTRVARIGLPESTKGVSDDVGSQPQTQ